MMKEDYRKFLGSSFLSDFTLVICCEPPAADTHQHTPKGSAPQAQQEQQHADTAALPDQQQGCCAAQHLGAAAATAAGAAELPPGTPDIGLSPTSSAAAAAASNSLQLAAAAAAAGRGAAGRGSSDGSGSSQQPCSGQQHHEPAELSPHSGRPASPAEAQQHRAAGAAGLPAVAVLPAASELLASSSSSSSGAAAKARFARNNGLQTHHHHHHERRNSSSSTTSAGGGAPDAPVITMPVHGVVLAAASPYFETLLRCWASPGRSLHMVVGPEQLPAAQALLAYMYTASLAPSLAQADLLQLLLLADRFDVARAVAAARRALAALSPAALEWGTLLGLWGLPGHLFDGDADEAAALRGVAWERLAQLFGDLEEAWGSADARGMWQQLPPRAISALVASDALAVASENTTLAAVSSWIAHQQQQQQPDGAAATSSSSSSLAQQPLSAAELQLLAASIRLPALGPAYLSYVAMQHEWFASCVDAASLARAAAYAAAPPEVRKDLANHTAAATAAAAQAAAALAAAPARHTCSCGSSGSSSSNAAGQPSSLQQHQHGDGSAAAAATPAAIDAVGSSCLGGGWGQLGPARCSSCGGRRHSTSGSGGGAWAGSGSGGYGGGGAAAAAGGCSSSDGAALRAQLMALAQAAQRPRAISCRRVCQFSWRVDLACIHSLWQDVAAAGSRDSRILRSPAHCFAGYEWALQLEVTQTRGATGFDASKPWSLGVFLTCQVRLEQQQPGSSSRSDQQQQLAVRAGGSTPTMTVSTAGDAALAVGRASSSSGSSSSCDVGAAALPAAAAAAAQPPPPAGGKQQQLVDFGFVSTSASISVKEAAGGGGGGGNKRLEKSWEHAVVRYRASWGWPDLFGIQAMGWQPGIFERWLLDNQLHLSAAVRVLG